MPTASAYLSKVFKDVRTLARVFAGENAEHPRVLELDYQAAEAQILFARVKEFRSRVWEEAGRDGVITKRGRPCGRPKPAEPEFTATPKPLGPNTGL